MSKLIHNYISCRKFCRDNMIQMIANLPIERTVEAPSFTYISCNFFGPLVVKDARQEVKRYRVVFTCLSSRAFHVEVA